MDRGYSKPSGTHISNSSHMTTLSKTLLELLYLGTWRDNWMGKKTRDREMKKNLVLLKFLSLYEIVCIKVLVFEEYSLCSKL
jgi:hypothetical protein